MFALEKHAAVANIRGELMPASSPVPNSCFLSVITQSQETGRGFLFACVDVEIDKEEGYKPGIMYPWMYYLLQTFEIKMCVCPLSLGENCETLLAPCSPRPCKNGGVCKEAEDYQSFSCICPEGWQGIHL